MTTQLPETGRIQGEDMGASAAADRATRPAAQAPAGLGDSASIPSAACRNCAGEQWVCENHLDQPWETSGHAANCGAGAPCPVCRPDMANAHLLELAARAASKIGGMERDCPSLVDWDERGPDLPEQIEAVIARYKAIAMEARQGGDGTAPSEGRQRGGEANRPDDTSSELERLREALSDDICVNCGKSRKSHAMNGGVGMCQIYPMFRSQKQMLDALSTGQRG